MADLFRLYGKVAVVIGGGGGIGKALSLGLARQGAGVAIASRNLEKLQEVAKELAADAEVKTPVKAFKIDATDEESVKNAVKEIVAEFGTVDILVNSQGQNIKQPFESFPVSDWDLLFDNNVKGVMLCCREFGKVMLEKKSGKIINISSVRGFQGRAQDVAYAPSKGAVNQLTRSLAIEWGPRGIHVNAIAPVFTRTAMSEDYFSNPARLEWVLSRIPMKRTGELEDLFGPVVFLASEASSFVNGHVLLVDGGWTAA